MSVATLEAIAKQVPASSIFNPVFSQEGQMFRNILVPLDGSNEAACVLPHAIAAARAFAGQITLMQVLAELPDTQANSLDSYLQRAAATAYLESVKLRFEASDLPVATCLLTGNVTEQLIELAAAGKADLVILSGRGEVMKRAVQQLPISTLIVRSSLPVDPLTGNLHYRRILLPLDGSERAGSVVTLAVALSQAHQADLHVVQIVRTPEMARHLTLSQNDVDLASRISARNQADATRYLDEIMSQMPPGTKADALLSDTVATSLQMLVLEQNIDLVILSSHGDTDETRHPYGGVTSRLIADGRVPLLIVRGLVPDTLALRQSDQDLDHK